MQVEKFGIGQPVRRKEDARFITGRGRYTDDINLERQAYAFVLRSPYAHAEIGSIDTGMAQDMPGVLGIWTQADLEADGIPPLPCLVDVPGMGGAKMYEPPHHALAKGRVRYVGDPVALVVAETYAQAQDAAEAIMVDYQDLPAVVDTAAAAASDAPLIWPERGSNLCVHWESHPAEPIEAAFAKAHKTVKVDLINNRVVGAPMEPRVAIGDFDPATGKRTVYTPTQGVIRIQTVLADTIYKIPRDKLHVISPDTGGGFGLRGKVLPELVLVTYAAGKLHRPVKWLADRQETFLSDPHGRDHVTSCEMAFDENARIIGMRADTIAAVGGYLCDFGPRVPTVAGARIAGTVYDVPVMRHSVRVVFTNTVPTDAYRGAGRPEMAYQMERLLDAGAKAFGLTREEIRRRNYIKPEQLPYKNQVGMVIDSGEFEKTMDMALKLADWDGFETRRAEAARRGKLRGIGLGYYIEASGGPPNEEARVTFEPDGKVSLIVGTFNHGQGHETAFAQILSERLGVGFDDIQFKQGDTDFVKFGNGTGGSRSSQMGGVATLRAADAVIAKAKRIAAHAMEAAEADVEFEAGTFRVAGTDLSMAIGDVAKIAQDPAKLPEGVEPGLDETLRYERPTECNFPNGCHVCEVEIDPATAETKVVSYTCVDDCGVIINPMLVAGQVHGGVAQGLGQALLEHTAYDRESGQLIAGSFTDYCMPRADDMPNLAIDFNVVPNPSNELGVKGVGEAGACGAPPAIISAVTDALKEYGVDHVDMPLTLEAMWRLLNSKGAIKAA